MKPRSSPSQGSCAAASGDRSAAAAVPPLVHGGPDARGVARHDFSTNGNAFGPCPEALEAFQKVDATCYPDPHYGALRERLANLHGVAADRIVMAASASEFVFRITAAVRQRGGKTVDAPVQGYGDYARAARAWGMEVATEPDAADDAALVWRCDPSSPLGQPVDGLGRFIDELPSSASCVLDLAYEPLRLEGSLGLGAGQLDRVWQLWTPNKALGLTGIRAAYAIAPRSDAAGLRSVLDGMAPSWPVGAHGVALLECWAQRASGAWLARSRDVLRDWKRRQVTLCEELGWQVRPSVASFFCVDPRVDHMGEWLDVLRDRDIKVRETTSFGLPGRLRIAVLPPTSQDALRDAVISALTFPGPAAGRASRCRPSS